MERIRQHTALQSILLHLMPGLAILGLIFLFSNPLFSRLIGVDEALSPVTGYLLALLTGLIPIQLIILGVASKRETGAFRIGKVIRYTQSSPWKVYLLYVPGLILYFFFLFVVVAPLVQPFLVDTFFSWWPESYNFQLLLQDPLKVAGYEGVKKLLVAYILLSCILGPIMEEVYFRGYLLPRMEQYAGKWAPFLHTVLFSFYHFFSPWENLIRILVSYPLIYLVWRQRNIRIGMWVHVLVNLVGGVMMGVMILRG